MSITFFPLNEENARTNGAKERVQTSEEKKIGFGVLLMCIGFCSKTEESYRAVKPTTRPGGYEGKGGLTMTRYDYNTLRAAATKVGATQAEINALGRWFERYGLDYWNGEYYDADDGLRLFPVYKWDEELDCGNVVGYEWR